MCLVAGLILALRSVVAFALTPLGAELATVVSYVFLFGGMWWGARQASRSFGTGSLRRDLGWRIEPADLLVGPLIGVAAYITQVAVAIVIHLVHAPARSNGEIVSQTRDRPWLFAVLVAAAAVGAPIFEELSFRGVILAGLRSRFRPWVAVWVSSLLFGLYHWIPEFGWGNVGLVATLTVVGAVFGAAAQRTGRLGPSMVGHAVLNTIVLLLLR